MTLYDAAVAAALNPDNGIRRKSMPEGVCIVPILLDGPPRGILVCPPGVWPCDWAPTVDDLVAEDWSTAPIPTNRCA